MGRRGMNMKKPKWVRNRMNDGDMPACPYCGKIYEDGAIFNIKNYPDDGGATIFLKCVSCHEEAELIFSWDQIRGAEDVSDFLAKIRELRKEINSRGKTIQDLVDIIVDWPETGLKARRDKRMQERLKESGKG
jgi:hypothetical protein